MISENGKRATHVIVEILCRTVGKMRPTMCTLLNKFH